METYTYYISNGKVTTTFKNGRLIGVVTPYDNSTPTKKTALRWMVDEIKEIVKK